MTSELLLIHFLLSAKGAFTLQDNKYCVRLLHVTVCAVSLLKSQSQSVSDCAVSLCFENWTPQRFFPTNLFFFLNFFKNCTPASVFCIISWFVDMDHAAVTLWEFGPKFPTLRIFFHMLSLVIKAPNRLSVPLQGPPLWSDSQRFHHISLMIVNFNLRQPRIDSVKINLTSQRIIKKLISDFPS